MPRRSFLLKSSLSEALFNHFKSSYQSLKNIDDQQRPFVYVDQDGVVKLLTSVFADDEGEDGIFAVSMAEDGYMEFLAMQRA